MLELEVNCDLSSNNNVWAKFFDFLTAIFVGLYQPTEQSTSQPANKPASLPVSQPENKSFKKSVNQPMSQPTGQPAGETLTQKTQVVDLMLD